MCDVTAFNMGSYTWQGWRDIHHLLFCLVSGKYIEIAKQERERRKGTELFTRK